MEPPLGGGAEGGNGGSDACIAMSERPDKTLAPEHLCTCLSQFVWSHSALPTVVLATTRKFLPSCELGCGRCCMLGIVAARGSLPLLLLAATAAAQCPPGRYFSDNDCWPCPPGYICGWNTSSSTKFNVPCPAGYWCAGEARPDHMQCAGVRLFSTSTSMIDSGDGRGPRMQLDGIIPCGDPSGAACRFGTESATYVNIEEEIINTDGSIDLYADQTISPEERNAPTGYNDTRCDTLSIARGLPPILSIIGTMARDDRRRCFCPIGLCPAGFFCNAGTSYAYRKAVPCQRGHFCPEGSSRATMLTHRSDVPGWYNFVSWRGDRPGLYSHDGRRHRGALP